MRRYRDRSRASFTGTIAEAPSLPFEYDAKTYWFNFLNTTDNTVNTTGDDTFSEVFDQGLNAAKVYNITKDFQPLVDTNGALSYSNASRSLSSDTITGFANGNNGVYIAGNIYVNSADFYLFENGKVGLRFPSNRQLGFTHSYDEGGSNWAFRGPALAFSTWHTVEMLLNYDDDTCVFWYNGVEQSLAYNAGKTYSPSSSDRNINIRFGDGIMQQVVYIDQVPTDSIRESISEYMNGVRP